MKIIKRAAAVIAVILLGVIYAIGDWADTIYDANVNGGNYESIKIMDENTKVEQSFKCSYTGFDGFRVRYSLLNRQEPGKYTWQLREKDSQTVIADGDVDFSKMNSKGEYRVKFEKQQGSKNKEYIFSVQAQNVSEDSAITLYKTTAEELADTLTVDGEKAEGSIILKLFCHRFNVETFIVFCGFAVYVVAFIWFMSKLFK